MMKGKKRVHRLVTLPDYQGIGLGSRFIDFIAGLYKAQGLEFNLITTTPALRFSLIKNKNWFLRRSGHVQKPGNIKHLGEERYKIAHIVKSFSCDRVTFSFDYVGDAVESAEKKPVVVKRRSTESNPKVTQLSLF